MIHVVFDRIARLASVAIVGLALMVPTDAAAQIRSPAEPKTAASGWMISRLDGDVRVRMPAAIAQVSLTPHDLLPAETEIETGTDGTVILTDNHDFIAVRPNSKVILPSQQGQGFVARIKQLFGQAYYAVEKRRSGGFQVETVYLVAAVKGTGFSVSVDAKGATVSVNEGLVGVTETATSKSADVAPGMTASVSSTPGSAMSVDPTQAAAPASAPQAAPATAKATAPAAAANQSQSQSQGKSQSQSQGRSVGLGQDQSQGHTQSASTGASSNGASNGGGGKGGGGNGGGNGGGGNGGGGGKH